MNKKIATLLLSLSALPMSAQKLSVSKSTIDCGATLYEQPVTAVFEIENQDNKTLRIEKTRTSCGCLDVMYDKDIIHAGEKCTVRLTYDGRQLGHYTKMAGLYTNASNNPLYLTMKGVVRSSITDYSGTYPYKVGNLRVDKLYVEFDDVNKGDTPIQELHVVNEGTGSLTPNLMHLPPYLTAVATPETLSPGKSGKIAITLNSERLRDYGLTQTSVYLANQLGDKTSNDSEIIVSSVLLYGFDDNNRGPNKLTPALSLSANELNLPIKGKSKKSGKITLTNTGNAALHIHSLQMFTKGMTVTLNKRVIEPGAKATLKVTVTGDAIKALRTKPRILMITDDPNHSKVVINVNIE